MDAPIVKLYKTPNPWSESLRDEVLLQILQTAGVNLAESIYQAKQAGKVDPERSFAFVMLDPVNWVDAQVESDLALASVEVGPDAAQYLPNGFAKAVGHLRANEHMGIVLRRRSHLLGNDDFAWPDSTEYESAVGGGSGLLPQQDREFGYSFLEEVVDGVNARRLQWLDERRRENNGKWGWWNQANEPGSKYATILELPFKTLDAAA